MVGIDATPRAALGGRGVSLTIVFDFPSASAHP
jgi:hypothetical protein